MLTHLAVRCASVPPALPVSLVHSTGQALDLTPADDSLKLLQAEVFLAQDKIGDAERVAANILRKNSNHTEALYVRTKQNHKTAHQCQAYARSNRHDVVLIPQAFCLVGCVSVNLPLSLLSAAPAASLPTRREKKKKCYVRVFLQMSRSLIGPAAPAALPNWQRTTLCLV